MTDPRVMELMNQEIDGVNSPGESHELQDHLATCPEDRRVFTELKEAVGIFQLVEPLDPPASLHTRILAASEAVTETRTTRWRNRLADIFGPVLRPAVAASFALGLVAGLVLFDVYRGLDSVSNRPVPGHLQGMAGQDRDTLGLSPVLKRSFDGPTAAGTMRITTEGARINVDITLTSAAPVSVELGHPADWTGEAFHTVSGSMAKLGMSPAAVTFDTPGAGRWTIGLRRGPGSGDTVTLRIHQEGETAVTRTATVQP